MMSCWKSWLRHKPSGSTAHLRKGFDAITQLEFTLLLAKSSGAKGVVEEKEEEEQKHRQRLSEYGFSRGGGRSLFPVTGLGVSEKEDNKSYTFSLYIKCIKYNIV